MNADRRAHAVAVISADPMLAALLGAAVELTGYRAAFPRETELPRLRAAVVLIDATHPAVHDETLLGRALMGGARLILFGRAHELESAQAVAARYEMLLLALPEQLDELPAILARSHPLVRPPGTLKR